MQKCHSSSEITIRVENLFQLEDLCFCDTSANYDHYIFYQIITIPLRNTNQWRS